MREPRSENSWMHNSPLLMRGDRFHCALMHVDDAAALQIADGDTVRVALAVRRDHRPVSLTNDIDPGTIAVPHGWGHKGTGGWQWPTARRRQRQPADVERARRRRVAVRHVVADRRARAGD